MLPGGNIRSSRQMPNRLRTKVRYRVPAHVPGELVKNIDVFRHGGADPYRSLAALHQGPRVFYNLHSVPTLGAGTWVLTRAEDIRVALQQPEIFSSRSAFSVSALIGETWKLIPFELDPPLHTAFRAVLNGSFSPAKMAKIEDDIRARAVQLIDAVLDKGECEFVEAFARPLPVSIFMQMMGLPEEHMEQFNRWEAAYTHPPRPIDMMRAVRAIADYLRTLIAERRATPRNDLVTLCINAKVDDRALTDDEILGTCFLLFAAGLDTVTSSLSLNFRHLAMNPHDQARLRAEPSLIRNAVEELLRRYAVTSSSRVVAQDTVFAGATMKEGDAVAIMTALANLDPVEFDEPMGVDFDRTPNRHIAFMSGPHRCIGSHLARRELVIAIEEWLKRVPPFRVKGGRTVPIKPGTLMCAPRLPIEWSPQ